MNIVRPFNNEIIIINNFLFENEIDSIFNSVDVNNKVNDKNSISSEYFNNRLVQLPTDNNIDQLFNGDKKRAAALEYLNNKNNFIKRVEKVLLEISQQNLFLTSIEALINSDGQGMPVHFDDSPENMETTTHYGVVLYLNDDYEGGEIYYPKLDIQYKPKAGDMIIHPGSEEYAHGVRDISNGTRYVITFFACTENGSSL
jgi:hypothetical protein